MQYIATYIYGKFEPCLSGLCLSIVCNTGKHSENVGGLCMECGMHSMYEREQELD